LAWLGRNEVMEDGVVNLEDVRGSDRTDGAEGTEETNGKSGAESDAGAKLSAVKEKLLEIDAEIEDSLVGAAKGLWSFASSSYSKVSSAAKDSGSLNLLRDGLNSASAGVSSSIHMVASSAKKEGEAIQTAIKQSAETQQSRVSPQELDITKEIDSISSAVTDTFGKSIGMLEGLWNNASSGPRLSTPQNRETRTSVPVQVDRFARKVQELRANPDTYCQDPPDGEAFSKWREEVDITAHKGQIDETLASNPEIKNLHARMVPRVVDDDLFWSRYLFALAKLEKEEERRVALLQKSKAAEKEEEAEWSDNDDESEDTDERDVDEGTQVRDSAADAKSCEPSSATAESSAAGSAEGDAKEKETSTPGAGGETGVAANDADGAGGDDGGDDDADDDEDEWE